MTTALLEQHCYCDETFVACNTMLSMGHVIIVVWYVQQELQSGNTMLSMGHVTIVVWCVNQELQSGNTMLSMGHVITTSVGMCDIDIRPVS